MKPTFTLELKELQKAMQEYEFATKKDEVEILNRAGRNIAYRASSKTPTARSAKIRAELNREAPRQGKYDGKVELKYVLASARARAKGLGIMKKPEFRKFVSRFVSQRASSAGYVRSGWQGAVEALGGSFRGKKNRHNKGVGHPATVRKLIAEIMNTVPNAGKIGSDALQQAINYVSSDMSNYAQKKLSATARKYSGR